MIGPTLYLYNRQSRVNAIQLLGALPTPVEAHHRLAVGEKCSVMKLSCISFVIIIIEGENEHLSVIFIFLSSKDILSSNSARKSSKGAENVQVLHGN